MGLGKTVQTIAVMLERAANGPTLEVAPTSVCPNWIAEIVKVGSTLKPQRFAPATDRTALVAGLGPHDLLICSYGLLHRESGLLASRDWSMLDALTGTPIENYLDELWSLINFLNRGLPGCREAFQKRIAIPIERVRDAQARQALRTLIRPYSVAPNKAAVLSKLNGVG